VKKKLKRGYRVAKYVVYKQTIIDPIDHFWTFIGAFWGIATIGFFHSQKFNDLDNIFLIGSFGASAVLVFGATNSPLAQPRNLVGGHLLSAIIGVAVFKLLPDQVWISSALAVALSIVAMQMTKTMHPPGGATALIAIIGSERIKDLGFNYIFSPVLSGIIILLLIALVVNNIPKGRNYPYKH
jgi:CBS-domain-containing membrane protein